MSDPGKRPLPTRFWLCALAALAWWILTAVFTVAEDITDEFPRGVTIFSASVCVVLTVLLMLIYVGARWVAPLQEAVDALTAERDQVAARGGTMEAAFDAGRRYQEAAGEPNRPRLVN